jgi:naphthoate synthase/2-ketocyclohexanecarboxyl-CoA hydrolase
VNDAAIAGFEDVTYEVRGETAVITMNRPRVMNAFRPQTLEELIVAFREATLDPGVAAIVLTGHGDHFSTGGDVKWESKLSPALGREAFHSHMTLAHWMRNNGKPVIAAVEGYCVGGGNELNLLSDVSIAGESAKFGQSGPRVGSVPVWYGTQLLPRLIGDKRAKEVVFFCRTYTAAQAEAMGWINHVVPDGTALEVALAWAEEAAAFSAQSIRLAKQSLNAESDILYSSVLAGWTTLTAIHGNEEHREGMTAFVEKRKPNFRKFRRRDVD